TSRHLAAIRSLWPVVNHPRNTSLSKLSLEVGPQTPHPTEMRPRRRGLSQVQSAHTAARWLQCGPAHTQGEAWHATMAATFAASRPERTPTGPVGAAGQYESAADGRASP